MNNESLGHAHDNLIALFLCNQIMVTITMVTVVITPCEKNHCGCG